MRALILGSAKPTRTSLMMVAIFGGTEGVPLARLEARQELAHGWDAWQRLRARRCRHRQRAQRARPDVPNRGRRGFECHLHLQPDKSETLSSRRLPITKFAVPFG